MVTIDSGLASAKTAHKMHSRVRSWRNLSDKDSADGKDRHESTRVCLLIER